MQLNSGGGKWKAQVPMNFYFMNVLNLIELAKVKIAKYWNADCNSLGKNFDLSMCPVQMQTIYPNVDILLKMFRLKDLLL